MTTTHTTLRTSPEFTDLIERAAYARLDAEHINMRRDEHAYGPWVRADATAIALVLAACIVSGGEQWEVDELVDDRIEAIRDQIRRENADD